MMFITSISTHTPLAGRDAIVFDEMPDEFDFYSHAPCGARPAGSRKPGTGTISTHTPLAGRDFATVPSIDGGRISTHTPLAGRDAALQLRGMSFLFLLTRPLRGATTGNGVIDLRN